MSTKNEKGRPCSGAGPSRPRSTQGSEGFSSNKRLHVPERAPFGDGLSEEGQIRKDLQDALFNLGPQATPRAKTATEEPTVAGYDGWPVDELFIGCPGSRPTGRKSRTGSRAKLTVLALYAAQVLSRLPGYEYNPYSGLSMYQEILNDPWFEAVYLAECDERLRREEAGIPAPRDYEEPAHGIVNCLRLKLEAIDVEHMMEILEPRLERRKPPIRLSEKRLLVLHAHAANPSRSDSSIAEECRVSRKLVRDVRRKSAT